MDIVHHANALFRRDGVVMNKREGTWPEAALPVLPLRCGGLVNNLHLLCNLSEVDSCLEVGSIGTMYCEVT